MSPSLSQHTIRTNYQKSKKCSESREWMSCEMTRPQCPPHWCERSWSWVCLADCSLPVSWWLVFQTTSTCSAPSVMDVISLWKPVTSLSRPWATPGMTPASFVRYVSSLEFQLLEQGIEGTKCSRAGYPRHTRMQRWHSGAAVVPEVCKCHVLTHLRWRQMYYQWSSRD